MGIDYQVHRASVDMSKAFRQFQKADNAFYDDNEDSAVDHLSRGMDLFQRALDHLAKAEEDAYNKAGDLITKGNAELQKSLDEYADGKDDSGARHYADALDYYDQALDIID